MMASIEELGHIPSIDCWCKPKRNIANPAIICHNDIKPPLNDTDRDADVKDGKIGDIHE